MKQRVIDFLMGKQPQTAEVNPTSTYGADVDNFINALKEQPYMQKLYNAPIQERLSDEQIVEKVANGLNLGIPELAQAQKDVGIRIPQGTEQVAQAQLGEFNKPMVVAGINNAPREGGLIQGYKQGYNLNYDNPTNTVGTRIGQAVGTLGRAIDTPLGRGLIAYGLSNAVGDTNPLEQALTAGVGRQTNLTKDKAYRQNLQQMGYTQEEIDSIPGIVNDQVYTNLIRAQQLRDNAEYRNMLLENNAQERAAALEFQRMKDVYDRAQKNREFNYRAQQDAIDNEFKRQELANKQQKGASGNINNLNAVNAQLQRFEDSFADMPGKIESNTLGRVRAATGFQTKQEANFNSQRQLLFNKIARDLGGEKGVLSDQDIKRIEGALPSYTDSLEQKNAKMEAIYDLLNDRLAVEGGSLQQPQQTSETIQVGNYKVRVK